MSYMIQTDSYGHVWIRCSRCGMGSYNPKDIEQKYCGNCHVFHGDELTPTAAPEGPRVK